MKIYFVCHANVCRSFIAQELMKKILKDKKSDIEVFSRGLYADSSVRMPDKVKDYLLKEGIGYRGHTPELLTKEDMRAADIVFVMERGQLECLLEKYAQYTDKIFLLCEYAYGEEKNIDDPIGLQGRAFEKNIERLKDIVNKMAKKIS